MTNAAVIAGSTNGYDRGTIEKAVGIRMVSWVGGSISRRFGAAE